MNLREMYFWNTEDDDDEQKSNNDFNIYPFFFFQFKYSFLISMKKLTIFQ